MKCPSCGHENPEGSEFCLQCGSKLVAGMVLSCPACGYELPPGARFCNKCGHRLAEPAAQPPEPTLPPTTEPTSFTAGRHEVKRFHGEGGKKKLYLAHDALLDRDVAFALIKTEGLDEVSRTSITREAQAMGSLGAHPPHRHPVRLGGARGPALRRHGADEGW